MKDVYVCREVSQLVKETRRSNINESSEELRSFVLHRSYSARSSMNLGILSIDVNLDSTIGTVTRT